MISNEQLLFDFKQRVIRVLGNYTGIEVREQQVVSDFQMNFTPNARAEDVRQALNAVKDDGNASRRMDDNRGWVWAITPAGNKVYHALQLED